MAKFDPPFASLTDFRFPTNDEQRQGFPCGPADREMFNGLFHRLEAEVGNVITYAGIEPTNDRFTQLREAIESLIAVAIGQLPEDEQPDLSGFLLMAQARTRLPIYPDVMNADGRIGVTSPATGTVRVPGGVTFNHRGIFPITTAQQDFTTAASKTYHLRWNPTNGFTLNDLTSPTYNPSGLPESNRFFDSGFDDMLVSRVITNSSNHVTITNLANKDRIQLEIANNGDITNNYAEQDASRLAQISWNLARTPVMHITQTLIQVSYPGRNTIPANAAHDHDEIIRRESFSRYGSNVFLMRDGATIYNILATVVL